MQRSSQYSQLVIVQSNGTNATVTMHELQDGVWTEILRTDGFVGSNGVGEASEFTSATPQGTFPLYLHLELIRIRERKFLIFR